jgi:hypothetical protein
MSLGLSPPIAPLKASLVTGEDSISKVTGLDEESEVLGRILLMDAALSL